jgi:hypothetical protein
MRIALAICGAAALAVGLKVAWSSSSASTAVVAGASLLALAALLDPRVTAFRAWFKDSGVSLETAQAAGASEALKDSSSVLKALLDEETVPAEDLRDQVAGVAVELDRAAADETLRAFHESTRAVSSLWFSWPGGRGQREDFRQISVGADSPADKDGRTRIVIRANIRGPVICSISGPSGLIVRPVYLLPDERRELLFPDEFPKADILPGEYRVTVTATGAATDSEPLSAASFFVVPERDT